MTEPHAGWEKGILIKHVLPGSVADEMGIVPGDQLISIDGREPSDIIDYQIAVSSEEFELEILKEDGRIWSLEIEKDIGEVLGLSFTPSTISPVRRCNNKCIFCFIDQNPPGMRATVNFKDDDYRLSFLEGNYITLNNLTAGDISRVIHDRISPLYVSVHTTNPALREKMMCNRRAAGIMETMRTLTEAGIHLHGQIVVCPGWNDGQELKKSINDLGSLGSTMESVAVVPVGLTAYREKLTPLVPLTTAEARETVSAVHSLQEHFLKTRGSRFVFLADEYYLLAEVSVPSEAEYEDYPQLANGVGLIRLFLEEYKEWCTSKMPPQPHHELKVTVITGAAAKDGLVLPVSFLNRIPNLDVRLEVINSRYFGPNVTVAGLITGFDLIEALKGKDLGRAVIFPDIMLKEGEDVFLDNRSYTDVASVLGTELIPVSGLTEMSEAIGALAGRRDSQS
ncbi:MAG: DUF512 domain-containing protein [Dethiobacteria bacterium]